MAPFLETPRAAAPSAPMPHVPRLDPTEEAPSTVLGCPSWHGQLALSEMDEFKNLDSDIEGSANRWKKLVESEAPEKEIFPKEWKNKTALQKLCMVRCMRPDRMTYAIK
ncbi:Dynein heavy chain 17, axonemal [Saguinus oedipus]|uniref:Dynein heavy chain 17, axonemal n=1 Tax=Saguinus oedipus TaxID=9490 RepID=A0ABQ9VVK1_SAGOE|nr:Dynein heavy chain 17, axonemal [Saguinus oedipus]